MRRPLARCLAALVIAASISTGHARQARDPAQTPAATAGTAGAGRLAGVVVDAQTVPQPVRRAIVTLTGAEIPTGRAAITDADGRFSFDRLPAGRFTLTASKPAYLRATYGAIKPGGTGTPITLGAAQQLTNVTMTLPRGGVIAGTLRDEGGAPVVNMEISFTRVNTNATAAPAPAPRADPIVTDHRGEYRGYGLLPGTYIVSAGSRFSMGLGEVGIMSTTDVDATFARLRRGPAATTAARESAPSSIVRPSKSYSTAQIFYPGATSLGDATPVTLALGEERTGVDFVYRLARSASIRGTINGFESGPLPSLGVFLNPDAPYSIPGSLLGGPSLQQRPTGSDGSFTFSNVTPGKYTLLVRTNGPGMPSGRAGGPPVPAPLSDAILFATMPVEISGDDINGLSLTLQPALHLRGTITFQSTTTSPPADPTKFGLRLSPASAAPPASGAAASPTGRFNADGTFDLPGVLPGSYRISTIGAPPEWWDKSAILGGKDVLDVPLEVGTGDVNGVAFTCSDRPSQIAGRLVQANGAPVSRYFVVAFPADRALWLPFARRMKSARPSTDGQFRLDRLPAGDYYLAAIVDADQDDWQTPAFLSQAVGGAVKVTVAEGETKTQDLRIGG